jgi:hypothetical protein
VEFRQLAPLRLSVLTAAASGGFLRGAGGSLAEHLEDDVKRPKRLGRMWV